MSTAAQRRLWQQTPAPPPSVPAQSTSQPSLSPSLPPSSSSQSEEEDGCWENAQEIASFSDASAPPVYDEATGVLRGGKMCGVYSPTHRRRWPLDVLRNSLAHYEGAACYVDHDVEQPYGSRRPRTVTHLLGTWHNVHAREDGLYGDLHANPKHPMASQMGWWANQKKAGVGFSQNVDYRHKRRADGIKECLEINKVYSVDFVANPGTSRSATEQAHDQKQSTGDPGEESAHEDSSEDMTMPVDLAKMTAEELKALRPDLFQAAASAQESAAVTAELTAARAQLAALKAERDAATRLGSAQEWAAELGLEGDAADQAAAHVASITDDVTRAAAMQLLESVAASAAEMALQGPNDDDEEDAADDDVPGGEGEALWPAPVSGRAAARSGRQTARRPTQRARAALVRRRAG